jgi:hypothetical protein
LKLPLHNKDLIAGSTVSHSDYMVFGGSRTIMVDSTLLKFGFAHEAGHVLAGYTDEYNYALYQKLLFPANKYPPCCKDSPSGSANKADCAFSGYNFFDCAGYPMDKSVNEVEDMNAKYRSIMGHGGFVNDKVLYPNSKLGSCCA